LMASANEKLQAGRSGPPPTPNGKNSPLGHTFGK
jgi:hypothetical protein